MTKPDTVFKYMGANFQTIINIKAQSFYMSPVFKLNDPYDSLINFKLKDLSDDEIDRLRQHKDSPPELIVESNHNIREKVRVICQREIKENQRQFFQTKGVTCFSEKKDSLLMWSHYGDGYKGMCLEFKTQYTPFEKLQKVKYSSMFPTIDVAHFFELKSDEEKDTIIEDLYCTKSKDWEYEKEWRLIHEIVGTKYVYNPEALKAIYFGPKTEREVIEIVCLIIQGQNPQVEFWEGDLSDSEFKVVFRRFNYNSYIEVKKKTGLIL